MEEEKRRSSYVRRKTRTEVGESVKALAAVLLLLAVVGLLIYLLISLSGTA